MGSARTLRSRNTRIVLIGFASWALAVVAMAAAVALARWNGLGESSGSGSNGLVAVILVVGTFLAVLSAWLGIRLTRSGRVTPRAARTGRPQPATPGGEAQVRPAA